MNDNCPNNFTCIGCKYAEIIERTMCMHKTPVEVSVIFRCTLCSIKEVQANYFLS